MPDNFEFRRFRNDLAHEVSSQKNKGDDTAGEKLTEAQETEIYKVSSLLKEASRSLPKEANEEIFSTEGTEEDPTQWDTIDISDKISQKQRLIIDHDLLYDYYRRTGREWEPAVRKPLEAAHALLFPQQEEGKEPSFPYYGKVHTKEASRLVNAVTGGSFFDRRNLNHLVGANRGSYTNKSMIGRPFDRHSVIEESKVDNGFYTCAGENPWTTLARPTIILSPENAASRRFVKEAFASDLNEVIKHVRFSYKHYKRVTDENSIAGYDINEVPFDGRGGEARLLFLANQPMAADDVWMVFDKGYLQRKAESGKGYTWMDVADVVVDLRAGKVWKRKHSEEEKQEVAKDIEYYREQIKQSI